MLQGSQGRTAPRGARQARGAEGGAGEHALRADAARAAAAVAVAIAFAACGGSTSAPYAANPTIASLQAAHWTARLTAGMPDTYTGARQVAYIEARAPDGAQIDMQLLETADKAGAELSAAERHGYRGTAIGNVLVVAHVTGATVPSSDVDALRGLLRS